MSGARLKDVASLAGVAVSTASICLRHGDGFTAETVERVRAAASQLGYLARQPAPEHRELPVGVAGVVLHDTPTNALRCGHTLEILRGLSQELVHMGMGMQWLPASQSTAAQRVYREASVDIVLYLSVSESATVTAALLHARAVPTVHLQSTVTGPVPAIRTDDVVPMRQLVRHVMSGGHERIAVVTQRSGHIPRVGLVAKANWEEAEVLHTRDRLRGIAEEGLEPYATYEAASSSVQDGLEAGRVLLSIYPRPTAVICLTDMLAAGVMVAARERGLGVPNDLAITGWDGLEMPALAPHRLTTVLQSGFQKGVLLAAYAAAVLDGRRLPPFEVPQFVSLGTTTTPPDAR